MKNIYEILKEFNVEIPEDKKKDFDKVLFDNYKSVEEVNGIKEKLDQANTTIETLTQNHKADIEKRDGDLAALQKQLQEAGVDKESINDLTQKLASLQADYDKAKTENEAKLVRQKYEFLVKESCNALNFTSNGAKKAFVQEVLAKNLPVENDKLLGFEDFVSAYKEQDAGTFVVEDSDPDSANKSTPKFTTKQQRVDNTKPAAENKSTPVIW